MEMQIEIPDDLWRFGSKYAQSKKISVQAYMTLLVVQGISATMDAMTASDVLALLA